MMYNVIFGFLLVFASFNLQPAADNTAVAQTNDTAEVFKELIKQLPKIAKEQKWNLSEGFGDTVFISADADYLKFLKTTGKSLVKTGPEKYVCDCAIKAYDKYPQTVNYVKVGYFVQAASTYIITLENASAFPLLHKSGKYKGLKQTNGANYDAKYALKTRCELAAERQRYIIKFRKENNTFNLVSVELTE